MLHRQTSIPIEQADRRDKTFNNPLKAAATATNSARRRHLQQISITVCCRPAL